MKTDQENNWAVWKKSAGTLPSLPLTLHKGKGNNTFGYPFKGYKHPILLFSCVLFSSDQGSRQLEENKT